MKNLVFCCACMIFCAYLYGKNTIAYAAPGLWYDGFVTSMTSQKISEPTRFQITWDDKNLYVVIDMHGKHLRRNKEYKYRPGIWPKTEIKSPPPPCVARGDCLFRFIQFF